MQEDCRILLPALENPRNWRQKTWSYTGALGFGYRLGSLPEALDSDMSSRGAESGTGAE
jgi:hypothetical protein